MNRARGERSSDSGPIGDLGELAYVLAIMAPWAMVVRVLGYLAARPRMDMPLLGSVLSWGLAGFGPLAMIIGAFALAALRRAGVPSTDRNLARAAIIVGALATVAAFSGITGIDESKWRLHEYPGRRTTCLSNVKQIAVAIQVYQQDWDARFPLRHDWNATVMPYIKNEMVLRCPSEKRDRPLPSYAVNFLLSGVHAPGIAEPESVPAVFDSVSGRNRAGGFWLLPDPPRHGGVHTIGFLDGHVKQESVKKIPSLAWSPIKKR